MRSAHPGLVFYGSAHGVVNGDGLLHRVVTGAHLAHVDALGLGLVFLGN